MENMAFEIIISGRPNLLVTGFSTPGDALDYALRLQSPLPMPEIMRVRAIPHVEANHESL